MTPLIFLDTETTGLVPGKHVPWELAFATAVHDEDNEVLYLGTTMTLQLETSQRWLKDAAPKALEICRFHERYGVESKPVSWLQARDALAGACRAVSEVADSTTPPHLVGAVPSFDHAMMCSSFLRWPDFGEGLWHYHLIDVEVLAAGRFNVAPPYSSDDLAKLCGATGDESLKHTAAGDVAWTIQMYVAVYDLEVAEL